MNTLAILQEEENVEENVSQLKNFYTDNISFLKTVPINIIPYHVLSDVGMLYHSTLSNEKEWREFGYKMGVHDNLCLYKIERIAKDSNETPVYIVLNSIVHRQKKFGHVVEILLEKPRLDILFKLKPYVTELLNKKSLNEVGETLSIAAHSESTNESSECSTTIHETISLQAENELNIPLEIKYKAKHKDIILCKNSASLLDNSLKCSETSTELVKSISYSQQRSLIVLIQHTDVDWLEAEQLASLLRDSQIIVKTLVDIDHLLLINSMDTLQAIYQEVDFIVPVVSQTFKEQVSSHLNPHPIGNSDAMHNKCLYELYENEFMRNRCNNFRVRPVLLPDVHKNIMSNNLLFCKAFRLWKEVPKLISVLKKTKALIPNYTFTS